MIPKIDELDRKILSILQKDATHSIEDIAQRVGSSKTPVWNRIKKLEKSGIITKQVALIDRKKVGLGETFFMSISTSEHRDKWFKNFQEAIDMPEILEVHRLTGETDYLLKVHVKNTEDYNEFYQRFITKVDSFKVVSSLSMQVLKEITAVNL